MTQRTHWDDCWKSGPEHYECARAEIERLLAWTDQDEPLPEDDAIKATFPLNSKRYDLYAEAQRLVSAKRSKGALVDLVNWLLHERDALRAELEREVKNKKEFERDWLDACDRLSQAEAERDALRAALDWYGEKAKEMGKAALHSDSKRMLSLMHELAVDYGKRAALGER